MPGDLSEMKAAARALWAALGDDPAGAAALLADVTCWHGFAPVGTVRSGQAVIDGMFAPLKAAVPDLTRQTHIFMAGQSDAAEDAPDGGFWVAGTGYHTGTGAAPLFGLPVQGHDIRLRWGEFLRIEDGEIVHAQTIWDLVDLAEQIGTPILPRPRGASHVYPAPTGVIGTLDADQDAEQSAETLSLGRDFIFGALNGYDEDDLGSMGMAQFFHPNIKWYGPGGIGACLSLAEFQDLHQAPWLTAFPNRKVQHLESLFAEGPFLAASGPKGVVGAHTGPYLGHAASGAEVEVSGLDFWLRDGTQFVENWVFVDMIHLFAQMGHDLLAGAHD